MTETTIHVKFIAESIDFMGYTSYVFENLESTNWDNKYIGRCLNSIYHELISEEAWHFVKKFKNPKIDFGILNVLVAEKTKNVMRDFFKTRGVTLPF